MGRNRSVPSEAKNKGVHEYLTFVRHNEGLVLQMSLFWGTPCFIGSGRTERLQKIFHRCRTSPVYEIRHLCINVLGFAPSMQLKHHKAKLARCAEKLAEREIIELPEAGVKQ